MVKAQQWRAIGAHPYCSLQGNMGWILSWAEPAQQGKARQGEEEMQAMAGSAGLSGRSQPLAETRCQQRLTVQDRRPIVPVFKHSSSKSKQQLL